MNRISTLRDLFLVITVIFSVSVIAEENKPEEEIEFSQAETLLFLTDQLSNINKPIKLKYVFEKTGTYEDGFKDTIELNILKVHDTGMKHASLNFFTGERHQFVPENENTNGNPVLATYLQGDVYEMDRLTDGHWRYFHRRLKFAFSDSSEVRPVTFTYNGKEMKGQEVFTQPYLKDPKRPMFEAFATKSYSFIFSDEIPGMLYQIKTIVPAEQAEGQVASTEPLIVESLTFVGVEN